MKFKNFWLMTLAVVFATPASLSADTLITGNPAAAAGNTFSTTVLTSEVDECTGDFYVGLFTLAGAEGGFVISKLPFGETAFTPLANNPLVINTRSRCLNLPYGLNKPAPFLAVIQDAAGAVDRRATVLSTDGTTVKQSEILHDAVGADNRGTAATAGGIIINPCIAVSENHIFTMVRPLAGGGVMGDPNTGMSVTRVTPGSLALDTVNANTGASAGNLAFRLDATAGAMLPTGSDDPFFFAGVPTAAELWVNAAGTAGVVNPNLYWDERLQRLYMGSIFESNAGADAFKIIAAFRISDLDVLSVDPIVPDAAVTGAVATAPGHLLGIGAAAGAGEQAGAFGLNVMHTSTGLPYIIFNGGLRPAGDSAEDKVWALPLINDPLATLALSGTVSDNVINTAGFFGAAATAGSIDAGGDAAVLRRAQVGAGALPIRRTSSSLVQALEVIGDTVFAAEVEPFVAGDLDAGQQPGVFSSTAQFDLQGRIISWTPWQRVEPFTLFSGTAGVGEIGKVQRVKINPVTGKAIVIEGDGRLTVKRIDWNTGAVATDLATNVNAQLSDGAFSALDLHSTTRGFGSPAGVQTDVRGRYTLFGGNGKVVTVRTGSGTAGGDVTQVVTTDFSTALNLRTDTLPGSPGPVQVLEYSRRLSGEGAQNYFFAGTPTGLFAFAATAGGGGFTAAVAVDALNAAVPFDGSFTWQKVGLGIPGLDSNFIVDIKTQGQTLYCMTCERRTDMPPRFRLLRIPFATTIGAMFASTNIFILGDSADDPEFADIVSLNGMQIFSTGATATPDTKEQICLATDNGLFHSRADQAGAATGSIGSANSAGMVWTRYPGSEGIVFTGITGANAPRRHTVWPIGIDDDGLGTFERGRVYQTSAAGNAAGTLAEFSGDSTTASTQGSFNPGNLNAEFAYNPSLESIPLIKNFCSPDGRRFFTTMAKADLGIKDQLQASPFQNGPFCSAAPNIISNDPALIDKQFFGCTTTGHTGELCILTDQGIVVLS